MLWTDKAMLANNNLILIDYKIKQVEQWQEAMLLMQQEHKLKSDLIGGIAGVAMRA